MGILDVSMDFGRLTDLRSVDFSLPADHPRTASLLAELPPRNGAPRIHVGTPRWSVRSYVGTLFPPGTKSADFLRCYAEQFSAVELNSTFYGVRLETIKKWRASVPAGFRFCPKLPKTITHELALENATSATESFVESIRLFGDTLGPAWILLPPGFGPHRAATLNNFVRAWPGDLELAVEFREEGWFRPGRAQEETFALLEQTGTIAILTDVAGRRDVLHQRLTTPHAFIRFTGNHLHPSDYERLERWAHRIREWIDQGLRGLYFFLHQPEEHLNIEPARFFVAKLNETCGLELAPPRPVERYEQGTFF